MDYSPVHPLLLKNNKIYQCFGSATGFSLHGLKLGTKVAHHIYQRDMASETNLMFLHSRYGGISMGKGKNIIVILRNGIKLTYKDAKVVEGKKTWIYQINRNEHPKNSSLS